MHQKRIFLSHSSKDANAALALCAAFEQNGVACWMAPRNIPASGDYASSIVAAIRDARGLLVLLSENANESPHIVREVERAASHRLPLFPVRIESVQPSGSLEYFLSNAQWIDAFSWQKPQDQKRIVDAVLAALPGDERRAPVTFVRRPSITKRRLAAYGVAGAMAVAAIAIASKIDFGAQQTGTDTVMSRVPVVAIDSLSVGISRFENLSSERTNAYIGAGIADHLTSVLTAAGISVKRSTAPESVDVRSIGSHLGVAHVLRGSIQQDRQRIRIAAQLMRTSSGAVAWAQSIDRPANDLFALEDSVSLAIAAAVKGRLAPADSQKLRERPTNVVAAYDAYLQAKFATKDSTPSGLRQASEHLERAVRLDPQFAAAFTDLAQTYSARARTDSAQRRVMLQKATSAAQRATWLRNNLSQATAVLNNDTSPSERKGRRSAVAESSVVLPLLPFGRSQGGLAAAVSTPVSNRKETRSAFENYYSREYSAAEQAFRALIAADPQDALAETGLGYVLLATQRAREAAEAFTRAALIVPRDVLAVAGYGAARAAANDGPSARAALGYLESAVVDSAERALGRAIILGTLGPKAAARVALARAKPADVFLQRFASLAPILEAR